MKGNILNREGGNFLKAKKLSYEDLILKLGYTALGMIFSKGEIFGGYYPFGIALAAAVPGGYILNSIIGTAIGYFFTQRFSVGMWYITMLAVVAGIRWTFSDIKKIRDNMFYPFLVGFTATLLITPFINYGEPFESNSIFMSVVQALICGAFAYFLDVSFKTFYKNHDLSLGKKETVCIAMTLCVFIICISQISIKGISLSRISATFTILLFSYLMGVTGGSIAGISLGMVLSLSSMFKMPYLSAIYGFSGMISGMFSNFGKFAVCIAFLTSGIISSSPFLIYPFTDVLLYEIIFSTILFAIIPTNFFIAIKTVFPLPHNFAQNLRYKKKNEIKKDYVIEIFDVLAKSLSYVNDKLEINPEYNLENMYVNFMKSTCEKCRSYSMCWTKNLKLTQKYFDLLLKSLLSSKNIDKKNVTYRIKKVCKNPDLIFDSLLIAHDNYISKMEATLRAKNLNYSITEKSLWTKELITYAVNKQSDEKEDILKSKKIKNFLKKQSVFYSRCSYKVSNRGRHFIEISTDNDGYHKISQENFTRKLAKICDKNLDSPVVVDIGDEVLLRIPELANLSVEVSLSHHACNNSEFCGDYCSYFYDGTGQFIAIISDGMGTGGHAAVDGAFTATILEKMIKLGSDAKSSLNIANLSVLGTSRDEALTAVDVLILDLFSGQAEFVKAGGPFTLIYSDGDVTKLELTSLPVGIFNQTNIACYHTNLSPDSWILLMSDGVTDIPGDWIQEDFKTQTQASPKQMSESILGKAIALRKSLHDDDITALAVKIVNRI